MRYDKWTYLYPPRPDKAIPPELLGFYEARGWSAQFKKNGTCGVLGISPAKDFFSMNRHKANHKTWQLSDYLKDQLIKIFPQKKWIVIIAEILHLKTPSIKDTLYIFDTVVWNSELLVGSTFAERALLLDEKIKIVGEMPTHYVCDPKGKIWYAKRFTEGFKALFDAIKEPKIDEGLVLKNPKGKLSNCSKPDGNNSWQVKCRHPHANYNF